MGEQERHSLRRRAALYLNRSISVDWPVSIAMRVVKQPVEIPVSNFDNYIGSGADKERSKHGPLLPSSIRCIIAGPSCSGKTNILFNMLFDPNGLVFENLYVFSKSLYQPKYQFLTKVLPKEIGYFPLDDNINVMAPNEAKPNSIMVFDDIACEKHGQIRAYFTMGRHSNIDVFYLGQTYSHIPKQLIRDNANFLILFRQDNKNLRHVYHDHVNTDMSFESFNRLCTHAWKDNHGFIVIDKERDIYKGRYRIGLDSFVESL